MRSRVMHSVTSICIYMYVCQQKTGCLVPYLLLSVICCLLFEFKHLQCGLLRPVSYTDRAIHVFPNKARRPPWPWNIFFWVLMAHHTLWARLENSCSDQSGNVVCFSECFSSCATTVSLLCMYAVEFQIHCSLRETAHAQYAQGIMCSLELQCCNSSMFSIPSCAILEWRFLRLCKCWIGLNVVVQLLAACKYIAAMCKIPGMITD